MARLSVSQERLLAVLTCISVFLSLLGSSAILYSILADRKQRRQRNGEQEAISGLQQKRRKGRRRDSASDGGYESLTYQRLLLAMSMFDIVFSIALALQRFLLPTGSYHLAIGNQTTCNIMGTISQIGLAGILYYCMLNTYFMLTIRLGVSRKTMRKWIEPCMHLFAAGFPITTGVTGGILGVYDHLDLYQGCYVSNYPKGCHEDPNVDCASVQIGWAFGGTPFFFAIASLVINNMFIYRHVRKRYNRAFESTHHPRHSLFSSRRLEPESPLPGSSHSLTFSGNNSSRDFSVEDINRGTIDFGEKQRQRLHLIASQCFCYVAACILVWTPIFVSLLVETLSEDLLLDRQTDFFWLSVITSIMTPLSGFFNAFVYFRPRYLLLVRKDGFRSPLSAWKAMYMVVVGQDEVQSSTRAAVEEGPAIELKTRCCLSCCFVRRNQGGESNDESNADISSYRNDELSARDRGPKLIRVDKECHTNQTG